MPPRFFWNLCAFLARLGKANGYGLLPAFYRFTGAARFQGPLVAAQNLGALDLFEPRPEFKAETRTRLLTYMRANPHRGSTWSNFLAFRYAASLALLFVALAATGTALAQKALPGDTLFGWKLASERIWLGFQGSPVEADIYLSGRRVIEIQAIQGRANLEEIGVGAYSAVLQQLSLDLAADPEKATGVDELLQEQRELLKEIIENSQADLPELDELFGIVVFPVDENGELPAGEGENQNPLLPAIVTVVPLNKKEEEEQSASGNGENHDSGDGQAQENQTQENNQGSQKNEQPGLIEEIISGLFGGN